MFATVDDVLTCLAGLDGVFDAPAPEGDPVDLLAHGLQCADLLRERRPGDVGLQLAGLVHDIGHAVGGSNPDHAGAGARAVRTVLGDRVADLVGLHVAAKRYLAATEDYTLSHASRLSLQRQGAAMSPDETAGFARHPLAADAIELRRADEAAKVIGRVVPGLTAWTAPMTSYARRATAC